MNRKSILAVLLALALGLAFGSDRAVARVRPSSDLLLPSFEVDLGDSTMTTLWSVANALDLRVSAVATLYTNWGIPVLEVPLDFAPRQVQTLNLRDWIVLGQLPGGSLSADQLAELQAALSGEAAPKDGLFYSTPTTPGRAMGYAVVRVQGTERPAALWGDFFTMGPGKTAASGDILVDLSSSSDCSDLCSRHALRFLAGAPFAGTQLVIWTPKSGQPSTAADDASEATVTAHARLYDQSGQPLGERQLQLQPMAIVDLAELAPGDQLGWIDLDLGTSSFVGVRYSGKGTDAIAFQSACLTVFQGPPPGLTIRKVINGYHPEAAPGPILPLGSPITWSYVVKNTGQVPLTHVQVSDDKGVAVSCPKTTLDPDEQMVCTGKGTAVACQYSNVGTVLATPPNGPALEAQDTSWYYGDPAAAITVTLATNGQHATAPPGIEVAAGSKVTWTYLVTNTGKSTLDGVAVTDDHGVPVSCPRSSLAPGASMTCTASAAAVAGQYANVGTASGKPPCGPPVQAQDRGWYHTSRQCTAHPAIEIEKYTNGQHVTAAPGPTIAVGDPVTWTYEVTNTGDVALSSVAVSDDQHVAVSCPKSALKPGETMTCSAHGAAVAGQYKNVGTATGQPTCGAAASDHDASYYYGQPKPPGISIKKYTNGQYVTGAPGPKVAVGSAVTWTYEVKNTGQVTLSNVHVSDNRGVAVSCPKTTLAVGEVMTCTGYGTATACQYSNTGTATGASPTGATVTDHDDSWYFGTTNPAIQIKKYTNGQHVTAAPGPTIAVGAPVTWTYEVTNSGDVALSNVAVADDQHVAVSCPKSALQPGETMTCSAHGTAVAGQYKNVGTATGQSPCGTAVTAADSSWYYGQGYDQPGQGCTPGYWKNHPSSWPPTGYSTSQTVASVFSEAARYPSRGSATLLQALSFQGGPDLDGGVQTLLRAGVSALLNAADPLVNYPRKTSAVISSVNAALASGSRDTMITLAGQLDADNNLPCPLN
jgi:hypothetical protein